MDSTIAVYVSLAGTIVVTVATVVLAGLTFRYVKLTGRLVEESQRLRDPVVTVDFELPDFIMLVVVENHGLSPARNIRLELSRDSDWLRGRGDATGLSEAQPFSSGVSYLTPGRKLKYEAGVPNWREMPDGPVEVAFRLTYESLSGERFQEDVRYDFRQMERVLFDSFRDPNEAVAKAIRDAESSRRSQGQMGRIMRSLTTAQSKRCEMCAETILGDAKKCKHCGAIQESKLPSRRVPQTSRGAGTAEE
jgi:hypothetical protein